MPIFAGAIAVAGASFLAVVAGTVLLANDARSGLLFVMFVSAVVALTATLLARHLESTAPV